MTEPRDATQLLVDWAGGDEEALARMLPLVYDELRALASSYMRRERRDHTLQTTGLVHEAYLRLIDQRRVDWRNRAQFLGVAAQMMRRVLLNHARDRVAAKRGAGGERVSLTLVGDERMKAPEVDVLDLHDALEELAAIDRRKGLVVELKYFGGLTTEEIAAALGVSSATVEREWAFSKAWLRRALAGSDPA